VLAFSSVFLVFWKGESAVSPAPFALGSSVLAVSKQYLDFGEVWARKDFRWDLAVRNCSADEITIYSVVSGCSCASTARETSRIRLPPGDTVEVPLLLDLISEVSVGGGEPVRGVAIDLIFGLGQSVPPARFTLCGRVRRPFTIEPAMIQYGESLVKGRPFTARCLSVKLLTPLREIRAHCDPPVGSVSVRRMPHGTYTVLFEPLAQLPEGGFSAELKLVGVTEDGEVLPPWPVKVLGNVMPEIGAIPSSLYLGIHRVGQVAQGSVIIRSAAERKFRIAQLSVVGPGRTSCSVDVHGGESQLAKEHTITIALALGKRGHNVCELRVSVEDADGSIRQVAVPVSAYAR